MSFDYTTLITDRAQGDVDTLRTLIGKPASQWTEAETAAFRAATMRGAYNYTDLNRVDACLEDLAGRFRRAGYALLGYERVKIERTVKPDGGAKLRYLRMTITALRGSTNVVQLSEIRLLSKTGSVMEWPNGTTVTASISAAGDDESPDKLIDGSTETKFCSTQFVSGAQINIDLGDKILDRAEYSVWQWFSANDYEERDPVSFELSGSTDGQTFTAMDSATNADIPEPRKSLAYSGSIEWPEDTPSDSDVPDGDERDPYTWYVDDVPTAGQMARYLQNVAAVRDEVAALASTPDTPESMALLNYVRANHIEAILLAVDDTLTRMTQSYFYTAEIFAGEV